MSVIRFDITKVLLYNSVQEAMVTPLNPEMLAVNSIDQAELEVINFFLMHGPNIIQTYIEKILKTPSR